MEKFKLKENIIQVEFEKDVKENDKVVNNVRKLIRSRKTEEIKKVKGVLSVKKQSNLIATTGKNVLTKILTGDTTYTGAIDWGALGNGTTTFSSSDTKLYNEVYRKQASSRQDDNHIAYIDWFIASGDIADQTFTEFGNFIDGNSSADTGQAFSLVNINWVKSGSLFISAEYDII